MICWVQDPLPLLLYNLPDRDSISTHLLYNIYPLNVFNASDNWPLGPDI
jgi:hypothetical protein